MKNILMVAFHFPPQSGSSGILRTLKFCRYLPDFGWKPTVLTAHPRAYEKTDQGQLAEIPENVTVLRPFALDSKRHLSIRGRHSRLLSLPDPWVWWTIGAVPAAMRHMRQQQTDAIFSTYPIASAQLIGYLLHRLTSKPWIVDLRDSMTEDNYPVNKTVRKTYLWIERKAAKYASLMIFTAPSAQKMYLQRYPSLHPDRTCVIPNGFDRSDFSGISSTNSGADKEYPLHLVHNGLIYPEERDPRPFFAALAELKKSGQISSQKLKVELRASGSESSYQAILNAAQIDDIVTLQPQISYRSSLEECMNADGMLLFQARNCDHQIPAKVYEYFAIGKPILALTSESGDTARLLNEVGGTTMADIADQNNIACQLVDFLNKIYSKQHPVPDPQRAEAFSRRNGAKTLAAHLTRLTATEKTARS